MEIIDVRARVLKVAKPERSYSGGAGVSGRVRRGAESDYQIIQPYPTVYSQNIEALVVEIETNTGLTGVGEGQFPVVPEAGAIVVESLLRPLLIGEDPRSAEELYRMLYGLMNCRGHTSGLLQDAIAAVDCALWDVYGKAEGVPVCQLLGGAAPTRLPIYVSGLSGETVADRVLQAQKYVAEGVTAFKLFLGKGVDEDVQEVAWIREALGPDVEIMVDVQWMYEPETAVELGKELQQLGVSFFETPCAPEDLDGSARVAAALELPVALGECERTSFQVQEILRRSAADIVQPDIGRTGISEGRAIIRLAKSQGRGVTLHMGVGLFAYIASGLHVAASDVGPCLIEYQPQMLEFASSLLEHPFEIAGGTVLVPNRPGLGFEVDSEKLRQIEIVPPGGRWVAGSW